MHILLNSFMLSKKTFKRTNFFSSKIDMTHKTNLGCFAEKPSTFLDYSKTKNFSLWNIIRRRTSCYNSHEQMSVGATKSFSIYKNKINSELNQNLIKVLRLTVLQQNQLLFTNNSKRKSFNFVTTSQNLVHLQNTKMNLKKQFHTEKNQNKINVNMNSFIINSKKYIFLQAILQKSLISNLTLDLRERYIQNANQTELTANLRNKNKQIANTDYSSILLTKKYLNYYYLNLNNSKVGKEKVLAVHNIPKSMVENNAHFPKIQQKKFLSYWLLPIIGFYSLLSVYRPIETKNQSLSEINAHTYFDKTHSFKVTSTNTDSFNDYKGSNNEMDNLSLLIQEQIPQLNKIWFKDSNVNYNHLKENWILEMDQLAISYLNEILTSDFQKSTKSSDFFKIETETKKGPSSQISILKNQNPNKQNVLFLFNQYKSLKSTGILHWYQILNNQFIFSKNHFQEPSFEWNKQHCLKNTEKKANFSTLTQDVNIDLNLKKVKPQSENLIANKTDVDLFSWEIMNSVNSSVQNDFNKNGKAIKHYIEKNQWLLNKTALNDSKSHDFLAQKPYFLNNTVFQNIQKTSFETKFKSENTSEQGLFKNNVAKLHLNKITFMTRKPYLLFDKTKHSNLENCIDSFKKNQKIHLVSQLRSQVNVLKYSLMNANSTIDSPKLDFEKLDLEFAKSSLQQYKKISLFLDNLISNYNWNIIKNLTTNTDLPYPFNLTNKSKLTNRELGISEKTAFEKVSAYMLKKQFKENLFLSKQNILELLNTQLTNQQSISAQSGPSSSYSDFSIEFNNQKNVVKKGKALALENKTSRSFNNDLDSVFNSLILKQFNLAKIAQNKAFTIDYSSRNIENSEAVKKTNWTNVTELNKNSQISNNFIKFKTPVFTANSLPINGINNSTAKASLTRKSFELQKTTPSLKQTKSTQNNEKSSSLIYTHIENQMNSYKYQKVNTDFSTHFSSLEKKPQGSIHVLKNWILIRTNVFNNYLKKIQSKLNSFYKMNTLNSKKILQHSLILNPNFQNANSVDNFNLLSPKKTILKSANYKNKLTQKRQSDFSDLRLNYTHSLPIVLKHKKIFNYKAVSLDFHKLEQKDVTKPDDTSLITKPTKTELEQSYLNTKKDLQKKHRAKKQRLESRRQKKRKRFYPRPVWLRLRLAFDFSKNTGLSPDKLKTKWKMLNTDLITKSSYEQNDLNKYLNSLMTLNKNSKVFSQKFLEPFGKVYLNNISDSVANTPLFTQNIKTLVQSSRIPFTGVKPYVQNPLERPVSNEQIVLSSPDSNKSYISPYHIKTNKYQYNNIVLNLWLSSSKKIKLFNTPQALNKSFENSKSDFTKWNTSKIHCYTTKLKDKFVNKKESYGKAVSEKILTKSIYQDLSKYAYKEKLFLSRKSLADFKNFNGKQYTVFENKSNTNQPKKTNSNNMPVRDFWIWLYNLTTTNQWTNTFLLSNGITRLAVPIQMTSTNNMNSNAELEPMHQPSMWSNTNENQFINTDILTLQQQARLLFSSNKKISNAAYQEANLKNLNRISWALNKTNLWSNTNTTKRLTLWSSQKLRNQSKNNKTKFIEKQIQKKINSTFSNFYLKSFLTKSNNNYYKFRIFNKMHQKEQKFEYLDGIQKTNNFLSKATYIKKRDFSNKHVNTSHLTNSVSKIDIPSLIKLTKTTNLVNLGFISKPTVNLHWWNGINIKTNRLQNPFIKANDINTLTDLTNTFYLKTFKNSSLSSSFNMIIDYEKTDMNSRITETLTAQALLANNYNILLLALVFHFCAIISLISISQIRCFFKFHLILVHKFSNFYLQMIYKNLAVTTKMFDYLSHNKTLKTFFKGLIDIHSDTTQQSSFRIPPTSHLTLNTQKSMFQKQNVQKIIPFNKKALSDKKRTLFKIQNFQQKNLPSIVPIKTKPQDFLNFNQNITNFQFIKANSKLQKATGLTFENPLWLKDSKTDSIKVTLANLPFKKKIYWHWSNKKEFSNNVNLRFLLERFTLSQASKKDTQNFDQNVKKTLILQNQQDNKRLNKNSNLLDSNNFNFQNAQILATLNLFIRKYIIFSQLVRNHDKSKKTQIPNTGVSPDYPNLKNQQLAIFSLNSQLGLTEFTKKTVTTVKKGTLETTYKVVDSFEYCLKIIYSFFEKPAEFTMDWIAYAFLIEWSSDLLSFTPEKAEKQSWLAFSKFFRGNRTISLLQQTPSSYLNNNSGLFLTQHLTHLPLNLTLGQLLYKRLLYLNDVFLEIVNRPDTDLINRQKKGTLFWDIWSDVLIKGADKYNINIPSLSNIKEEQNTLIEKLLADNSIFTATKKPKSLNFSDLSKMEEKQFYLAGEKTLVNVQKVSFFNKQSLFRIQDQKINNFRTLPLRVLKLGNSQINNLPKYYEQNKNIENRFNVSTLIKSTQDVNQFVTYQSKETDLFLDYHPPKSFKHISAIRYFSMVQQPIGALVCQIYSGLLTKQIAKNVLVIGSTLSSTSHTNLERSQKTLLIQALAGETEIQIITDNASRYAIVNRGFAVGIKLLKDVFEAISLNTPCLFLLEDIHLIGERRPLLISDHGDAVGDEMSKSTETTFGAQRNGEAVHEKNQVLYQLSRHGIAHYKKPFKGDFSLSIPTNHFGFDLFFKSRYANYASTPINPLSYGINLVEFEKTGSTGNTSNTDSNSMSVSQKIMSKRSELNFGTNEKSALATSLQLADTTNQLLSPPSTSPFTVLLLKEQKKLKPKRIVKELPWIGLPSEQLALLPRVSYSVRAKVAALADLGFSNMSAKLDMITDLLVIIDSVRGNRGFVVFATTHLPHILDPALRRPGRLDETISIPTLSNIWTRWEFTKSPEPIIMLKTKTSIKASNVNSLLCYSGTFDYLDFMNLDFIPNITGNNNFFNTIITRYNMLEKRLSFHNNKLRLVNSTTSKKMTTKQFFYGNKSMNPISIFNKENYTLITKKRHKYLTQMNQIAYYQMGKKLITNKVTFTLSSFTPIYSNHTTYTSNITLTDTNDYLTNQIQYNSLYSSPNVIKKTLIGLLSGKLSQIFALQTKPLMLNTLSFTNSVNLWNQKIPKFKNGFAIKEQTIENINNTKVGQSQIQMISPTLINNNSQIQSIIKNILTLYGIDETWRAATSLTLSFIQKRYLYHTNLIVPKLLNFQDYSSLEEPPSPPTSNILIPAKRYENAKKALKENIERKVSMSIQDKLEAHNKQSYIKTIYNLKNFQNQLKDSTSSTKTSLVNPQLNSLLSLDSYERPLIQPSSITWHYQNKIFKRHRNYLNNQWWNGQLTEHNAETLFLSDIDWRYTFIENMNNPHLIQNSIRFFTKFKNQSSEGNLVQTEPNIHNTPTHYLNTQTPYQDIVIDFPDADQHYNPKHRRWIITSGEWTSWLKFDKKLQTAIFEHLIFESMIKTYTILNQNRELLDYSVAKYMKKGLIKDLNTNFMFKKF